MGWSGKVFVSYSTQSQTYEKSLQWKRQSHGLNRAERGEVEVMPKDLVRRVLGHRSGHHEFKVVSQPRDGNGRLDVVHISRKRLEFLRHHQDVTGKDADDPKALFVPEHGVPTDHHLRRVGDLLGLILGHSSPRRA